MVRHNSVYDCRRLYWLTWWCCWIIPHLSTARLVLPLWGTTAAAAAAAVEEPSCYASSATSATTPTSHAHPPSDNARAILYNFLLQQHPEKQGEVKTLDWRAKFKIHGWRWHTMSLIREAQRLAQGTLLQKSPSTSWNTFTDYVVNFNLKGLHKIQHDLFFPWVKEELPKHMFPADNNEKDAVDNQASRHQKGLVLQALSTVLQELQDQDRKCQKLGQSLVDPQQHPRHYDIQRAQDTALELAATAQAMLDTEQDVLIPLVAHFVPESVQSAFNHRVIASLGVWDSRLHLVHMYEAIRHDTQEVQIFQQEIPYLPRMMLARWKRNLYDPKVAAVEGPGNNVDDAAPDEE